MTRTCEDANSRLVDVITVADVDAEKRVHDSLVQIWKLKYRSYSQNFVQTLRTRFGQDFEVEESRF